MNETLQLQSAVAREAADFSRPYVVSWNLTYRCNLACEHCYLDAGGKPLLGEDDAFADRRELSTEECFRVVDEIAAFAPESLVILTGGEPLLRRDIIEIIHYAASKDLWVVVGTNGVKITENLARILQSEGVRGLSLSLDALDPDAHDRFRRVRGAWKNTVEGARILHATGLPFIVQTTVGKHNVPELPELARFAYSELGAKVWNLYFLVPTGRGRFVSDMSQAEYDDVLADLFRLQAEYRDRMLVNAKCAPHYIRTVLERDPESPFLKTFTGGAGGCPAGTHYMGIRPNGEVTPCPYLPEFAGNLKDQSLRALWNDSALFRSIRDRSSLGGKCGTCELSARCGGCRARAYGAVGDRLAEDPLCSYEPGSLPAAAVLAQPPAVEYGQDDTQTIDWDDEARARMKQVPMFVRGMVTRRVESWCRERGHTRVTAELLAELRSRMPTPKMFGRGS